MFGSLPPSPDATRDGEIKLLRASADNTAGMSSLGIAHHAGETHRVRRALRGSAIGY